VQEPVLLCGRAHCRGFQELTRKDLHPETATTELIASFLRSIETSETSLSYALTQLYVRLAPPRSYTP
jgi:hypothetical protein